MNQVEELQSKISFWTKRAEARKSEVEDNKNICFPVAEEAEKRYSFCLSQIQKYKALIDNI